MKKMLILIVAAALVTVSAMGAIADNKGPAEVKMKASMGDVNFNHTKHQELVSDCVACHHTGLDTGNCKACHDAKPDAPKAKKAYHKLCKDCHKKESGPTKCKACHVK